jgi:hypothetical protein
MATYNYPHVDITTKALTRRTPSVAESTATTLLAPFVCDRGPENELVNIDSMADFIATYGNLDYSKPGQRQILNIGNWLSAGGRVKALRYTEAKYSEPQLTSSGALNDEDKLNFYYKDDDDETTVIAVSYTKKSGVTSDYISIKVGAAEYAYPLDHTLAAPSVTNVSTAFTDDNLSRDSFINGSDKLVGSVSANLAYTGYNESTHNTSARLYLISNGESLDTGIMINRDVKDEYVEAVKATATKYIKLNDDCLGSITATAKYSGSYYNDISVKLTTTGKKDDYRFSVTLIKGASTVIEKFQKLTVEKLYTIEENSEYLGDFSIKVKTDDGYYDIMDISDSGEYDALLKRLFGLGTVTVYIGQTSEGQDATSGSSLSADDSAQYSALVPSMKIALAQPLESEFDVMLDCGYPESVKQDLVALFSAKEDNITKLTRDDAFLYLTPYVINGNGRKDVPESVADIDQLIGNAGAGTDDMAFNVGVYTHYGKVIDLYSEDSGKEVYVPATYELAGKIPAIDASYGVQYPVAGLTRGKLSDFIWIDSVPSNSEKNSYYEGRVNYIEKDSRGMYFMCQLTKADGDTALKFINNSRALLKMKKELRKIARNYLHEFNDRITKNNLLNALNTSLANWINNRTLSYGSISLQDYTENDTLSNEELLIQLDVKFTGTIEVISIDITVE